MSRCSLLVKEKYKTLFQENKEVINEMVTDLKSIAEKSRTKEGFRKSVDKYIRDTGEEKLINDYYKLLDIQKTSGNFKRVMSFPNKVEGLLSLLRASNYNIAESGFSVEAVMDARNTKYQTILDQVFTEDDFKILATREADREIIKLIVSDGKIGDPAFKKYADIFKKLNNYLHNDKVNVGIMENYVKDYAFNQKDLHNVEKMLELGGNREQARDEWVKLNLKNLDHEKTFPFLKTDAEKIEYLNNAFDGFIDRQLDSDAVDFSNIPPDRIKKQIPKKYSKPRTLYYTPEGLADMFSQFSEKPLVESLLAESAKTARDVSLFEVLGAGGQTNFANIVQKVQRSLQAEMMKLDPKSAEFKAYKEQIKEIKNNGKKFNTYFKEITNSSNIDSDNFTSRLFSNLRALTSMSSLGGAAFSAVTDLASGVTALQIYTGQNYFKLAGESAAELVKNLPVVGGGVERQKLLAGRAAISLESSLGNILRIQGSNGAITKGINKSNFFYNKVNPLQQQARMHRTAFTSLLSMYLGEWSGGAWKNLDPDASKGLLKAGIKENDWAAFQAMRQELKDGEFTVDAISTSQIGDDLANELIAKHKAENPAFVPKTPNQYRAYLEKRIDSYFKEFANMAAPQPGLRERVTLMMGTEKGTVLGELVRTAAMLKSFTVKQTSIMQRVYLARPDRAGKISHLSGLFLGLTTMGYIAESLKAISKNETPPDPTSPDTIRNSILRSGAGTLMADAFLSEDYGSKTEYFTKFAAGPVASKADELLGVSKKVIKGDLEAKDLTAVGSLLPGSNLWYLKSALHYTIMDDFKEEIRPGHKRRMEKRRRENEGLLWRQENIVE